MSEIPKDILKNIKEQELTINFLIDYNFLLTSIQSNDILA